MNTWANCVRNVMSGQCSLKEALQSIDQFYYEGTDENSYDFLLSGMVGHDLAAG